ncbi:MAG: hypothetical protein H7222_02290 [Methylotenera sp.]|nr:hypothetical protein [Oligoflexia bacterium]
MILKFILIAAATFSLAYPLPSVASGFDFDQFMQQIERTRPRTLDQALALLPESLRSNYTLIQDSHGLQSSSHEKPRAVLFGKDAQVIASFTADQGKEADNTIEIMQFNSGKNVFEFFTVPFPLRLNADGHVQRPETNPGICLTCHGSDPAPIWGKYPALPGVYASNSHEMRSAPAEEESRFLNFMKQQPQVQRYRRLLPQKDAEVSPNQRISVLINRWSARRAANRLLSSPHFRKYGLLMIYELLSRSGTEANSLSPSQQARLWRFLESDFGSSQTLRAREFVPGDLNAAHLYFLLTGLRREEVCAVEAAQAVGCSYDGFSGDEGKVAYLLSKTVTLHSPAVASLLRETSLELTFRLRPGSDADSSSLEMPRIADQITSEVTAPDLEKLHSLVVKSYRLGN